MTTRTSTRPATFTRPFTLIGVEGTHPPGTYPVEIDEEIVPGLTFPVYRRVETRITLPWRTLGASGNQTVSVILEDLEEALARDAAPPPLAPSP